MPDPTDDQRPRAVLMTGPPGWNSGPMPDPTIADLAAAVRRGWVIIDRGDHLLAEHRTGTELRVLAARTPAALAAKIAEVEAGDAGPGGQ